VNLAEIFSGDVDFYTDIQKGDRFRLLVDKKYLDGKLDGYGSISAAELMLGRRRLSAFRFQNQYYDINGKSLRKSLLKSPLKFSAPVTSRFSMARFHPILRIVRPHEGVDYGAPIGTPVASVASGRVISAGWNGGFGNSVRISHENGLETIYSHLSKMEVRAGERVDQGQPIGEVGTTGLSTGPHLDFRLLEHGKYRDPAKKIVPDAPPVAAKWMPQFIESRNRLRDQMDQRAKGPKDLARTETSNSAGGSTWK
jgi:murein DD-endopeptidase MepM/ murein hydrolase activator NlpD